MKPLTIASSPLRLSIIGGGTDVPYIYNQLEYGFTLSCALDLRIVVSITSLVSDNRIKLKYSRSEVVYDVNDIVHPIIRSALLYFEYQPSLHGGIEITSSSPIPSGTGLGSSGSFTVSLLAALFNHFQIPISSTIFLAQLATTIERQSGNDAIGFQDQYTSCLGGLVSLEYLPGTRFPNVLPTNQFITDSLNSFVSENTYLVRCHKRPSLSSAHLSKLDKFEKLHSLCLLAQAAKAVYFSLPYQGIEQSDQIIAFAGNISHSIKSVPPEIDSLRTFLLKECASYVRLLGAGGGGFLFVKLDQSVTPAEFTDTDLDFHKVYLSSAGFLIHQ